MRRLLLILGVTAALLSMGTLAAASPSSDLLPNEQHYLDDNSTGNNGTKSGSALNMVQVGQTSLADRGFNGDVFVHEGFAYVGRWGFFDPQHPQFCPAGGVAVIDATNPASPHQVANLEVPGASHEDVAVPATPILLAVFDTGCCTRGFHELEVGDRADLGRTFVYASLPYAERAEPGSPTGVRDQQGRGEAWIVDVTDPVHPALVSTFGIKKDLGLNPAAGQGCFAISFGHGMD